MGWRTARRGHWLVLREREESRRAPPMLGVGSQRIWGLDNVHSVALARAASADQGRHQVVIGNIDGC